MSHQRYTIITDLIGDFDDPVTLDEVLDFQPTYPGWKTVFSEDYGDLRLYADRTTSEDSAPTNDANWRKVTPDLFYMVYGRPVESEEV